MPDYISAKYSIFISSPSDVAEERKEAQRIIEMISRVLEQTIHVGLKAESWENLSPRRTRRGLQSSLNELVKDCDFFLLILNKRYGTVETGYDRSNTEREIDAFLEEEERDPRMMAYFKKLPPNSDQGPQEHKIREMKDNLHKKGVLSKEYENIDDFKEQLTHNLYEKLFREVMTSSDDEIEKLERLRSFWRFGISDNSKLPEAIIIYPPVRRKWMASDDDSEFWCKRLQPNVFFEDFKAISKIAKMLNIVGAKMDVSSNMTYFSTQTVYDAKNLIWICLPRLHKVIKRLETDYKDISRFKVVEPNKTYPQPYFKWRSLSGKEITVKSPLQSYLRIQRKGIDPNQEWNETLRNVVAKDFAIVARFNKNIPENDRMRNQEKIKEFFICGIHGLGTWGATHYLDRRFMDFNFGPNDNIQMLLEITYENGHIVDFKNVSEKGKTYFESACSETTIRRIIEESK